MCRHVLVQHLHRGWATQAGGVFLPKSTEIPLAKCSKSFPVVRSQHPMSSFLKTPHYSFVDKTGGIHMDPVDSYVSTPVLSRDY
eukprot:SAG22_NODE_159_length_16948_cov_14.480503_11_plen_84_part_00